MNNCICDERIFTICCPVCSRIVARAYRGSRALMKCSKCSSELSYVVEGNGASVTLLKQKR